MTTQSEASPEVRVRLRSRVVADITDEAMAIDPAELKKSSPVTESVFTVTYKDGEEVVALGYDLQIMFPGTAGEAYAVVNIHRSVEEFVAMFPVVHVRNIRRSEKAA